MKPIETITEFKIDLLNYIYELSMAQSECYFAELYEGTNLKPNSCYNKALIDVFSYINGEEDEKD